MSEAGSFGLLEGHRFMRLTTFRRSGTAVPTTVWFALADDRAYVFTSMNSGKVKRIRKEPRVVLTPSDFRGRPRSQFGVEVEARLMGKDEEEMPDRAIDRKYGWQYRLFNYVLGLPKNPPGHVFLELKPAGDGIAT